jgi:CBS domain-containing protein
VYHNLKLEDIMETPVITINPDSDLGQVVGLMDQTGCKHIPVIDGNDIIGIVTATDVIGVLATMKLIAQGALES